MELTQQRVRELFDYRDGQLFWISPKKGRQLGRPVGSLHKDGCLVVRIDYQLYKVHRLVFLWNHGYMPEFVDHADMNRANNKIENLRPATKSQNMANRCQQTNGASGFKGVYFHKHSGKWAASIKANKVRMNLGLFDAPEAAHEAYKAAALKHFGEFARAA
jgi:hypothetical protein